MVDFQLSLPGLGKDINSLTLQEKGFINYFAIIDPSCINPVIQRYVGVGSSGYGTSLIFALARLKKALNLRFGNTINGQQQCNAS